MSQAPGQPTILIAAVAGPSATTSALFFCQGGANTGIRITGGTLGAGESAVVQYLDGSADYTVNPPTGGTMVDLVDAIVGAATIGENESSITLAQRGWFKVVLTLVGSTLGVELIGNNQA